VLLQKRAHDVLQSHGEDETAKNSLKKNAALLAYAVTALLGRLAARTGVLGQVRRRKRRVNEVREQTRVETLHKVLWSLNNLRTIHAVPFNLGNLRVKHGAVNVHSSTWGA